MRSYLWRSPLSKSENSYATYALIWDEADSGVPPRGLREHAPHERRPLVTRTLSPYIARPPSRLATLIVEEVSQPTVPAEIQTRLLDPLGIDGMLLDFSKPIPGRFEIAHPWVDADSDGTPEDIFSRSRNWIASLSRILFYTWAEDFAVWAHELFAGKVLEASFLDEILAFIRSTPDEIGFPLVIDYGLGIQEFTPQVMQGQRAWDHRRNGRRGSLQALVSLILLS